jgi:hypothetical protein
MIEREAHLHEFVPQDEFIGIHFVSTFLLIDGDETLKVYLHFASNEIPQLIVESALSQRHEQVAQSLLATILLKDRPYGTALITRNQKMAPIDLIQPFKDPEKSLRQFGVLNGPISGVGCSPTAVLVAVRGHGRTANRNLHIVCDRWRWFLFLCVRARERFGFDFPGLPVSGIVVRTKRQRRRQNGQSHVEIIFSSGQLFREQLLASNHAK